MVVDEAVAVAIRGASQEQIATFVASCAERMAHIFTGLHGDDPKRGKDVELVIHAVEDLWKLETPKGSFRSCVETLEGFHELEPSDEEIIEVVAIYTFYSILSLRYAALYRFSSDAEDALRCAHACLTAMGQLDQNLPDTDFFSQEKESQRRSASAPNLRDGNSGALSRIREHDRTIGRERLVAIQRRLSG
jgi:hypothetical protein